MDDDEFTEDREGIRRLSDLRCGKVKRTS